MLPTWIDTFNFWLGHIILTICTRASIFYCHSSGNFFFGFLCSYPPLQWKYPCTRFYKFPCMYFHKRFSLWWMSCASFFVMSNTLMLSDLGHVFRLDYVYIQSAIRDSLNHLLESSERCSLQWLGEEICKYFSHGEWFQLQVPIHIVIIEK